MLALCVTGVWGEQGCSEALGRLSSLILSGQQRPVTVGRVLMVKHTRLSPLLWVTPQSCRGSGTKLPPRGRRAQKVFQTSLEEPDHYSAALFCCAGRHKW